MFLYDTIVLTSQGGNTMKDMSNTTANVISIVTIGLVIIILFVL